MGAELFGICPVTTAQRILSGKWTLLILYSLGKRTMRFNELQKELGDLTQATLSKQLRALVEYGLVVRTAYEQIPPKVEYSLSDLGQAFLPVLSAIETWGTKYIGSLTKDVSAEPQKRMQFDEQIDWMD